MGSSAELGRDRKRPRLGQTGAAGEAALRGRGQRKDLTGDSLSPSRGWSGEETRPAAGAARSAPGQGRMWTWGPVWLQGPEWGQGSVLAPHGGEQGTPSARHTGSGLGLAQPAASRSQMARGGEFPPAGAPCPCHTCPMGGPCSSASGPTFIPPFQATGRRAPTLSKAAQSSTPRGM